MRLRERRRQGRTCRTPRPCGRRIHGAALVNFQHLANALWTMADMVEKPRTESSSFAATISWVQQRLRSRWWSMATMSVPINGVRHDDSFDLETLLNAIEAAMGTVTGRR